MGFEIINTLKKEKRLTNAQIAKMSGVTLSTLDKITSGVNTNPKLDTLQAICRVLGCTLDDFMDNPQKNKAAPLYSSEAMKLAKDYDCDMDDRGRETVRAVADFEIAKQRRGNDPHPLEEPAPPEEDVKLIPLFGASFAAGTGEPDFGNLWEDYEVPADSKAEFAIKVHGDSMEPHLPDGTIALGRKQTPRDGDVAALLLDGVFLVKQVCQDSVGNIYLFSLNRARADADVTIWHDSGRNLMCFGTIIMDKRLPLPVD